MFKAHVQDTSRASDCRFAGGTGAWLCGQLRANLWLMSLLNIAETAFAKGKDRSIIRYSRARSQRTYCAPAPNRTEALATAPRP